MNYLENSICNFKFIEKSKFHSDGINIISISFFKMKSGYKNFNAYINGLKYWISFIESFDNNFIIRLFIDQSIFNDSNIMNIIKSSKKVEPILFLCADYVIEKFHVGLFASFIRFFPIFNFKNNDAKCILVADIDLVLNKSHQDYVYFYKYCIQNCKKIKDFTFKSFLPRYLMENKFPFIRAGLFFVPEIKYDQKVLYEFLFNIKKYKVLNQKDNIKYYENFNQNTDFEYGIDETFLNKLFFVKEIKKFNVISEFNFNYLFFILNIFQKERKTILKKDKIIIDNKDYTRELQNSINKINKKYYDYFQYIKDTDDLLFNNLNFYCLNHKFKYCENPNKIPHLIKRNNDIKDIFIDFQKHLPKDSVLNKILNSGILDIDSFYSLIQYQCIKINKDPKKLKYKYKMIYKTKY